MNATTQTCQNPKTREKPGTKKPVTRVKTLKLPTIKDVAAQLQQIKTFIRDEYRAFDDDDLPSMQITLACSGNARDDWTIQTGDNSYTGSAYRYALWGVSALYRQSNCRELAKELIEQIAEQWWSDQ